MIAEALAVALASAPVVTLDPRMTSLPQPGVIVFWASWCDSCAAELRQLPAIRRAADPLPVATLALDPPDKAGNALRNLKVPADAAFADGRPPAEVLARWGATTLPFAVAIGLDGRVCGRKEGLLGLDQVRQWARDCQ